ncbi:MAG: Fur family transcriptional regulator [Eubacteriales bacterium]
MINKRNTLQKRIVFDVFSRMDNHPSAGMVYEQVHMEYPNISRATVFRILSDAADEGKILRLKLNDSSDRYDITTSPHYHTVCRVCGAVSDVCIDFDDEKLLAEVVAKDGFLIESSHIEFRGVCSKCLNQKEAK